MDPESFEFLLIKMQLSPSFIAEYDFISNIYLFA